ncbi:hypothetical protein JCM16106_10060 [Hydrogenophilus islandicus]
MWRHDDQAATLRRLFRREPPLFHSLYAAGNRWPRLVERVIARFAAYYGRVLLCDEATASVTLPEARGAHRPADLLLSLQPTAARRRFDLRLPQGWGYLNIKAAAVALPLLDETQRTRLVAAFERHVRDYDAVVFFGGGGSVADASWWLTSAPRHWLVAEVNGNGWRDALARAQELVHLGVDRIALIADGDAPEETLRFLRSLKEQIVRKTSLPVWRAVPLAQLPTLWLGEGVAA